MSAALTDAAERFQKDVLQHQMTVLHNDGLYRHIRFMHTTVNQETGKTEKSSFYWFDLVTWPGCLVINGDMDSYTFSRTKDMFEFFRMGRGGVNPQYWAEKVPHATCTKEYSYELFEQLVTEHIEDAARKFPGLAADVRTEILDAADSGHEVGAQQLLADYRYYADPEDRYGNGQPDFEFCDTWEWDLRDWTYQFLWCCHAIVWGIGQYNAGQSARQPIETVELPA